MVKTKLFKNNYYNPYDQGNIDDSINYFISENPNLEVIDIKFSVSKDSHDIVHHALLLYKETK